MGKRGPRPEPTQILRMKGSWRANSREAEPIPPAGPIRCPAWIPQEAKTAWRVIAPMLQEMGVLTKADRNALTRYCVLWSRWRAAEEVIHKGQTIPIKNAKGELVDVKMIPQVKLASELSGQLLRLEQEFGLTPSARTRIHAEQHKAADPLGAFAASGQDDRPPSVEGTSSG